MKKSEMVDIIQKALTPVMPEAKAYFTRSISHHLLNIIEEHGMLPPDREGNDCSYSCEAWYEWEPEND